MSTWCNCEILLLSRESLKKNCFTLFIISDSTIFVDDDVSGCLYDNNKLQAFVILMKDVKKQASRFESVFLKEKKNYQYCCCCFICREFSEIREFFFGIRTYFNCKVENELHSNIFFTFERFCLWRQSFFREGKNILDEVL